MTKLKVSATYDYVAGHLRYADVEAEVDSEFWSTLNDEQKIEWLEDNGDLVNMDYEIEDYGELMASTLQEEEIK